MNKININNFYSIIPLNKIEANNTNIIKILEKNYKNFYGFGEIYSTNFTKNVIRAWKKHTKMFCNILVIKGSIKFVLFDDSFSLSEEIVLNDDSNKILLIKPNIWFGFKGLSKNNSIINISNILHQENEIIRRKYNDEYPKF